MFIIISYKIAVNTQDGGEDYTTKDIHFSAWVNTFCWIRHWKVDEFNVSTHKFMKVLLRCQKGPWLYKWDFDLLESLFCYMLPLLSQKNRVNRFAFLET